MLFQLFPSFKKSAIAWFVIPFFFLQCKKDKQNPEKVIIEHDTVKTAWQTDNSHSFRDQSFMGVYSTAGRTIFFGAEFSYYIYDSVKDQWRSLQYWPPFFIRRPAVSSRIFVTGFKGPATNTFDNSNTSPAQLDCFIWDLDGYYPSWGQDVNTIDSSFKDLKQFPAAAEPLSSSIDISDSNRIVLPIISSANARCFATIDVKADPLTSQVQFKNFHKIPVKSSPYYPSPSFHIGNRFFISGINDSTFLVREDHSVKFLMPESQFLSVFTLNGTYYASVQGAYQNYIYKTTDMGETWTKEFYISVYRTTIINFDGKLISIVNDRLWEVIINGSNITFKELNNDGIGSKEITGIARLSNRVYITTTSGLMYRPYSNFYEYK